MCRDHQYGCHATATLGGAWTGTETNLAISPPTEKPITLTQPNTKEGVEAWGIKLISVSQLSQCPINPVLKFSRQ
jgi:hypothetical protein